MASSAHHNIQDYFLTFFTLLLTKDLSQYFIKIGL
jgi:hypothetical protein